MAALVVLVKKSRRESPSEDDDASKARFALLLCISNAVNADAEWPSTASAIINVDAVVIYNQIRLKNTGSG